MASVVVSGRVDEMVKRQADRVISRAGKTSADVIRETFETIAATGRMPVTVDQEERFKEKRRKFAEFLQFRASLPPAPDWLVTLTDKEMNDMIAGEQIARYEAL